MPAMLAPMMTLFVGFGVVSMCMGAKLSSDMYGNAQVDSHCHSKCSFLGVLTGEGHPRNVKRVGKGAKGLCPDHTKIADSTKAMKFGEDAIEYVA